MIDYTITPTNQHICDSYLVSKRDFAQLLDEIAQWSPASMVWTRSKASLCLEWAAHNALYAVGYKPSRTRDVDLEYPQTLCHKVGYAILGVMAWPFIQ